MNKLKVRKSLIVAYFGTSDSRQSVPSSCLVQEPKRQCYLLLIPEWRDIRQARAGKALEPTTLRLVTFLSVMIPEVEQNIVVVS